MGAKYYINKGTIDDVDELAILYDTLNDYFVGTVNYPGWIKGIYPVRETAEDAIKRDSLFVLRKEKCIAGSVILNHIPEKAYGQAQWNINADEREILIVHTLVTHPQFMRQGIARRLLAFAEEYAKSLAMKAIRLDVSIENIPAIKLYEQSGYTYIETVDLGLPYRRLNLFRLYEMILPSSGLSD